ncbi:hypothetical protein QOZ80_7AG0570740 [Eleusine coracana subsp. coracana]|nr:hypothetical protein QOZ80_7AG0570740 [Eleusine coracana subsp. coracana]
MGRRHLLAAVAATIVAVAFLAPHAAGYPWPMCGTTNNFAPNSTFQTNLNRIAATLPNATASSRDLYATARAGTVPEQVWAMALCRSDINATECRTCITQAFVDAQTSCVFFRDATIYYNPCMLHYSDVHILPDDDTGPTTDFYPIINHGNVTSDPERFNEILTALVNATADYAAFNSTKRFATGEADFNQEFPKVYTVAQCPPDQPPERCRKCLAGIIRDTLPAFLGHIGGRVLWVNCTYRFETASFYNGPPIVRLVTPSPSSEAPFHDMPATKGRGSNRRKVFIIALIASITLLCAMLVGCILLQARHKKGTTTKRRRSAQADDALKQWRTEEDGSAFTLYDFSELADATDGFSVKNRLGTGGFGPVYKGNLADGVEIAVKRLAAHSVQGLVEFKNEIQLIAKLQHENLVRLVGCCVEEEEKMLVYEYMPNGSLDFFIFDPLRVPLLDWKKRLHIIEGIVQGLLYLHKHSRVRIIHRDLKASNILLDKGLNPKISDFGMARIFNNNITEANTNRVVGTYGYMAPEYASEGIFSLRSDVFSFGVLLLEIVSGKRNTDYHHFGDFVNLIGYAWQLRSEGRAVELIDLALGDCGDTACIMRCIKVALLCVQENAMDRPTMTEVAVMLGSHGTALKDPRQPPHFHLRFNDNSDGEDGARGDRETTALHYVIQQPRHDYHRDGRR